MCGICFLQYIHFNENDLDTLNKIKKFTDNFLDKEEEKENMKNNSNKMNSNKDDMMITEKTNNYIYDFDKFLNISLEELVVLIGNRGPDYFNILECSSNKVISHFLEKFANLNNFANLFEYMTLTASTILISSVLSLRGTKYLIEQPIVSSETNNLLQYNGEIFSMSKDNININNSDIFDLYEENDGLIFFSLLNNISVKYNETSHKEDINSVNRYLINKSYADTIFCLLNRIDSDHAFVFHDNINNKIIISRDIFGKRSLILFFIKTINILIVSSALTKSLVDLAESSSDIIEIIEIPANSLIIIDKSEKNTGNKLFYFQNEVIKQPSTIRFNSNISHFSSVLDDFDTILKYCFNLLKSSVERRICNLPEIVKRDKTKLTSIAVLFSGGIDSLLLAYFAALSIPDDMKSVVSIDLINLSFEKENAPDRNSGLIAYYEMKKLLPDKLINFVVVDKDYTKDVDSIKDQIKSLIYPRKTHMDFNIATALSIATQLRGIKINDNLFFPFMEDYMKSSIENLSKSTIGNNNYNNNILSNKLEKIKYDQFLDIEKGFYKSASKIVLSGFGADEFFGGYARYNSSFKIGGVEKLKEEMSKDINRIWIRNFGRDDRVCSDNGIELRFPFFDFELIEFLSNVKDLKYITNFEMTRGLGEKFLLREICRKIGFVMSNSFEKRAIQFGTKLAKETNLNKYGSNRKANGRAQYK